MGVWVKLRGVLNILCFNGSNCVVNFGIYIWHNLSNHVSSHSNLKHSRALLGSNSVRNKIVYAKLHNANGGWAVLVRHYYARGFTNSKKNPEMNRLRFISLIPLWLFKFFFRSVKVPSILLFVLGIPLQRLS